MPQCTTTKELILTGKNELGTLAKASQFFKENNINVECLCCYTEGGNCKFHFITSDNTKAKDYFAHNGWNVEENEVVRWTAANKPGLLNKVSTVLAEANCDIHYCYTAASPNTPNQDVIFCTNNNAKATEVLATCGTGCGCG